MVFGRSTRESIAYFFQFSLNNTTNGRKLEHNAIFVSNRNWRAFDHPVNASAGSEDKHWTIQWPNHLSVWSEYHLLILYQINPAANENNNAPDELMRFCHKHTWQPGTICGEKTRVLIKGVSCENTLEIEAYLRARLLKCIKENTGMFFLSAVKVFSPVKIKKVKSSRQVKNWRAAVFWETIWIFFF